MIEISRKVGTSKTKAYIHKVKIWKRGGIKRIIKYRNTRPSGFYNLIVHLGS